MAKQTDYFLEIARTKHPADTSDREVEPVSFERSRLQEAELSEEDEAWAYQREPGFEEKCTILRQELAALKEHYRPFMKNRKPKERPSVTVKDLKQFRFRYLAKGECFTDRLKVELPWENVTIPDYRGPAREQGKWKGYYTCCFRDDEGWRRKEGMRTVIQFQCVDYIAKVYVNGNFVGMHEGFFAPFSFDITDYLREENEITVLCENDIPILGEGPYLDGDKIYAATGPGWDDPQVGWHHCPAGAGIFGRVTVELRPQVYLQDVFVRLGTEEDTAEIRVGIQNYTDEVLMDYRLDMELMPRNFEGDSIYEGQNRLLCIGPGKNEYRYFVSLSAQRLWEPDSPWLYNINLSLRKDQREWDSLQRAFGLKRFISDENSVPKGKFYLNGRPIVLRGANEMGHLQQDVMQGRTDLLIDDILLAKLCNMNFYRVTQRPVQEEIYEYFDMLGMMHQCDLPLFSFLRRPQFAEAIRQTVEMEHLIRGHVSSIMVTFINEPVCIRRTQNPDDKFSRRYDAKGHRHLLRDELEAFFAAARKAVYVENPDRVIKNVEGDYDGPTLEGMPDFHCYTMWYTSHGEPIGRLMKGYLPPVKAGWMIGCGEYGAEGLDNEEVMVKYYPKEWLSCDEQGHWIPDKIVRSQTHSVHGDWYPEQDNRRDWIVWSQRHQANATKLMTDALRRRGDVINQTAIHLLIDAWPAGWMKALVCCDRTPKPAYFACREALIPLKLNLYTDRRHIYEDEESEAEIWIMNDTSAKGRMTVRAVVWEDSFLQRRAFEASVEVRPANSCYAGSIPIKSGRSGKRRELWIAAQLLDEQGRCVHSERMTVTVSPRPENLPSVCARGEKAGEYLKKIGAGISETSDCWLVTGTEREDWDGLYRHVVKGGKGILVLEDCMGKRRLADMEIEVKPCGDKFFAAAAKGWQNYDLSMLYNRQKDYIDVTADRILKTGPEGENLLYTYGSHGFLDNYGRKEQLSIVRRCAVGKGILTLVTLSLDGRVGYNPDLDWLLARLLR